MNSLRVHILTEANQEYHTHKETQENFGIHIDPAIYYQAQQRWPWAKGNQLQRRAIILAFEPSNDILTSLDQKRDSQTEIRHLTNLVSEKPKKFGLKN
jgi:hypothetical protein